MTGKGERHPSVRAATAATVSYQLFQAFGEEFEFEYQDEMQIFYPHRCQGLRRQRHDVSHDLTAHPISISASRALALITAVHHAH